MIAWSLLGLYIASLFVCLPKIFAKAGRPAWEGLVPFYNLYVWNKIPESLGIGRSCSWPQG